jgi:hypothetical protein
MIAPLWLLTEGYLVYGLTSLFHTVQLETTYTTSELREDLIASIHAVLLAPVLEELCFRQINVNLNTGGYDKTLNQQISNTSKWRRNARRKMMNRSQIVTSPKNLSQL